MPLPETLRRGRRVKVWSRRDRTWYLGLGTYLDDDLYLLDRGTFAKGRLFDIEPTIEPFPRWMSKVSITILEDAPLYDITARQSFVSALPIKAPAGTTLELQETTIQPCPIIPTVFAQTYVNNRVVWLLLKNLKLPYERHLALVANSA